MSERFPKEEMDLAHLFSVFDVETYIGMSVPELSKFGNNEVKTLLDMLSQQDDGTKKFYCNVPFIDITEDGQLDEV